MAYTIKLVDLKFDKEEEAAVLRVLNSGWISTGPMAAEFERLFSEMLGGSYALSMANCTVALHLSMRLLDIGEGDEVICPSLTFVATANAIRYVKAIPVFADVVSYENLTVDPGDIERKITPRTKALVVMHYGGFACDMDSIMRIAEKHNLRVIEDACHGPLSEYKGKKLGTIGDIGCFSFFSNKNISTGEGGMLVANSREIHDRARLLRSHGMTSMSYERAKGHSSEYDVVELGYNYRMDDIRAAIGIAQLGKLKADLIRREKVREWYQHNLGDINEIIIPFAENQWFSSNYIFPIVLRDSDYNKRNQVRKRLAEEGVQTSVHYPAVHRFSIYSDFYTELPVTDYVVDNLITLPMYGRLEESDVRFICETLKKIQIDG